jgi:hypothetical protein
MYTLSIAKNFPNVVTAIVGTPADVTVATFRTLAREIIAAADARRRAPATVPV